MIQFIEKIKTILKYFLEECKYIVKEKKTSKFIIDDMGIYSDDSDKEGSDEENYDEKNSDEEN